MTYGSHAQTTSILKVGVCLHCWGKRKKDKLGSLRMLRRNQTPWTLVVCVGATLGCSTTTTCWFAHGREDPFATCNNNLVDVDDDGTTCLGDTSNIPPENAIHNVTMEDNPTHDEEDVSDLYYQAVQETTTKIKMQGAAKEGFDQDLAAGVRQIFSESLWQGSPQMLEAFHFRLKETQHYLQRLEKTPGKLLDPLTLALCKNRHENCTQWALQGECAANPAYMSIHCAPACFTCDALRPPEEAPTTVAMMNVLERGGDLGVLQNVPTVWSNTDRFRDKIVQTRDYLQRAKRLSTLVVEEDQPFDLMEICRNQHAECTFWSLVDQCEANPIYMYENCAPACQSCHTLSQFQLYRNVRDAMVSGDVGKLIQEWPLTDMERGADMGLPQHFALQEDSREDFMLSILSSRIYYRYANLEDPSIDLDTCKNQNAFCTAEAVRGECDRNPTWMKVHCAPACRTCECSSVHNAPMAWQPGDLNSMFERLIQEPYASQYDVQVLSSPSTHDGGPYMIQLENVISKEEASGLIAAANRVGYGDRFFRDDFQTAKTATCKGDCYTDPIVQRVSQRINALTGFDDSNSEYFHLPR